MGEIDPLGTRREGLDAFLDEKVEEGYVIESRTDTHAIISPRPKGLKRFTSGGGPNAMWLKSTKMEARRCVRQSRDAVEAIPEPSEGDGHPGPRLTSYPEMISG